MAKHYVLVKDGSYAVEGCWMPSKLMARLGESPDIYETSEQWQGVYASYVEVCPYSECSLDLGYLIDDEVIDCDFVLA